MVPACSDKVSRVSSYSGYRHVELDFAYGTFTLFGQLSQNCSAILFESIMRSEPQIARNLVWPLSRSLAATCEISVDFSSSAYLDVSVRQVPFPKLWIHLGMTRHSPCRVSPFGHPRIEAYLQLPAAFRSLSRPSSAPGAKAFTLCSSSLELSAP